MREELLAIIEKNSRIDFQELAVLLGASEEEVLNELTALEKEGIICGYHTLINWEKTSIEKIDDPELKLETKIEKLEEMISVLEEKLVVAETVQDTMKAKEIFIQKLMLEKKLEKMREEYKKNGFDSKLTENIMSFFGLPQNIENELKQKAENFMKNSALARPFKPVMNFFKVKETLNRLDKINKSVDELVNMQVPFGEGEQRYQALANHLTRATYLQNKIEKNFKG